MFLGNTVSRFTLAGGYSKKSPGGPSPSLKEQAESGRERETSDFFVRRRVLGDAL